MGRDAIRLRLAKKRSIWQIAFVGMAISVFIALSGCVSERNNPTQTSVNSKDLTTVEVQIEDVNLSFVSFEVGKRIDVSVTYKKRIEIVDAKRRRKIEDAVNLKVPEGQWLLIYLQHEVMGYLNGGELPPTIRCRFSEAVPLRGKKKWWIAGANRNSFFGESTLSLRQGDEVLELLPGDAKAENTWVPLTPESYSRWWTMVDEKMHLSSLFE